MRTLPSAALAAMLLAACGGEPTIPDEFNPDTPDALWSLASLAPVLANVSLVGGPGDQHGYAVTVDGDMVFAVGSNQAVGQSGLAAAFGVPAGTPLWTSGLPGTYLLGVTTSGGVLHAAGVAIPPACGAVDGVGGTEGKTMLARFTFGGALVGCQSANYFPYTGIEQFAAAFGVTEGATPYVYAAGWAEQVGFSSSFPFVLAKFDVAGIPMGAVTEPGITLGSFVGCCPGQSLVRGIAGLGGDLYLAGESRLPGLGEDNVLRPVLMRYTPTLARVWKARLTDRDGSFAGVAPLGGDLFAVGHRGSFAAGDFLVERYDQTGARVWSATSGGAGTDILTGVVAAHGRLYASGYTTTAGAGGEDGVVLEFDPADGTLLSTTYLGATMNDRANGIATDGQRLFVVGESRSYATGGNAPGQSDLALWDLTLVISVQIDIKPGSDPNCFNNDDHGVIPVAILGSADFDVTAVDPTTVRLEGLAVRATGKSNKLLAHIEDVNGDDYDDLVVQIEDVDGAFATGSGYATITGNLFDGTPIQGSDTICVVG